MTVDVLTPAGTAPPEYRFDAAIAPVFAHSYQPYAATRDRVRLEMVNRIVPGEVWVVGEQILIPLRVKFLFESDVVVATENLTGIFGAGATPVEALRDLRSALVEHRDVLEESEPLSADLQQQLAVLRSHLRPA